MDVDQARTFLAVLESGTFLGAAERVHVSQSTVSMRIKALESRIGRPLFERDRRGARPTRAGTLFARHAQAVVRLWEQARMEVALPEGYTAVLTVGGSWSLWDGFLHDWLAAMRANAPEVAIRCHLGTSDGLMQRLVDGTLDLGVMYVPHARPGFAVELLFDDELVLVASRGEEAGKSSAPEFVQVDWGPEFHSEHRRQPAEETMPRIHMETGSLGLGYILRHAGRGYFPRRLVAPHLADGKLNLEGSAPRFAYPAYAVYPEAADSAAVRSALDGLRQAAAMQAPSD